MDEEQKKQEEAAKAKELENKGAADEGGDDEEDLFDPFATIKKNNEDKEKENVDKGKDEEDKSKVNDEGEDKEGKDKINKEDDKVNKSDGNTDWKTQYDADKAAKRDVSKYVEDHPEFKEFAGELEELASKAIVVGHSKPLEFALRNVRPASYWIEFGRKQNQKAIGNAMQTRIGGTSGANRNGSAMPDYENMSFDDFNKELNKLMRG